MFIGHALHAKRNQELRVAREEIEGLKATLKAKQEVLRMTDEGISLLKNNRDSTIVALEEELVR